MGFNGFSIIPRKKHRSGNPGPPSVSQYFENARLFPSPPHQRLWRTERTAHARIGFHSLSAGPDCTDFSPPPPEPQPTESRDNVIASNIIFHSFLLRTFIQVCLFDKIINACSKVYYAKNTI